MKQESSLTLTVTEAAELLRVSRNTAYSLITQGKIPSIRLGKRILVPRKALEALLEVQQPTMATQSHQREAGLGLP